MKLIHASPTLSAEQYAPIPCQQQAFALLKVNGGFVIDLSGTRLGWQLFSKLKVDMLSKLQ